MSRPAPLLLLVAVLGCGPSTVPDAEKAKDVSWLAEKAKAGNAEALAALCGLAKEGTDGALAALADARTGVDPAQGLESISCMVDLGLGGDAGMLAVARDLLKSPVVAVRTSTLNALQAAAGDPARRASVLPFVPDLQQRLRDEEPMVWKRSVLVLNALGPPGRASLQLALQMPERTRGRELVRVIVDLENIAPELGPPALAWIAQGEEEIFDHLLRIIVRSGTTIESAKPVILSMMSSGEDAKIETGSHLARALADEGRCDADVVRAVVRATPRYACEESCLVQARSVAYKCRQIADAVLREIAAAPLGPLPPAPPRPEGPQEVMDRTGALVQAPPTPAEVAGRPREIARATLGLE